jgi:hypothetical protein
MISTTEIRRHGLSVVDKVLKRGPVHALKNNEPAYVIMAEDPFLELSDQYRNPYPSRICRSLKALKGWLMRRVTALMLADELGLETYCASWLRLATSTGTCSSSREPILN